jgi:hypothetical protein
LLSGREPKLEGRKIGSTPRAATTYFCVDADCTVDRANPESNVEVMYHDEDSPAPVCIRGDPWGWILDVCTTAGFVTCLFVLIVSNMAIYCKVRKLLRANERYSHASRSLSVTESSGNLDSSRNGVNDGIVTSGSNRGKCRQVAIQSFLYCGGFLATYILSFLTGTVVQPSHHGTWWYVMLRCLQEILFPLQGFFNMCAYLRPKYMAWREVQLYRDGVPSRWKTFREAITTKPLPNRGTIRMMKLNHLRQQQRRQLLGRDLDQSQLEGQRQIPLSLPLPQITTNSMFVNNVGVEKSNTVHAEAKESSNSPIE